MFRLTVSRRLLAFLFVTLILLVVAVTSQQQAVEEESAAAAPPAVAEEASAAKTTTAEEGGEETPAEPQPDSASGEDAAASSTSEDATSSSSTSEDATSSSSASEDSTSSANNDAGSSPKKDSTTFRAKDHMDWGSYYDPQNIFCGKYDCYRILGFDYESFQQGNTPDKKEITKRYRSLSREWHPDKTRHKNAKDRFVKIARAYEVLTDESQRREYDFMRYDQEAYFRKYGASVLWSYAPKTDATFIVFLLIVLSNAFSWFAQQQKWQRVADRLIKAAVEEWSPSQGGTPESKQLREHAVAIMAEREKEDAATADAAANGTTKNNNTNASSKKKKLSGKEKKLLEQEALRPIVTELVNQMTDFGGGFHRPTWRDLLIVQVAKFPASAFHGIVWNAKYAMRRLRKLDLNDEERSVLTQRAVGPVVWDTAKEEEQQDMIKRELWILTNLAEWKEEQEVKNLSTRDQKYYNKMKKKGSKQN